MCSSGRKVTVVKIFHNLQKVDMKCGAGDYKCVQKSPSASDPNLGSLKSALQTKTGPGSGSGPQTKQGRPPVKSIPQKPVTIQRR